LDSGGVTALSRNKDHLAAYLHSIRVDFDGAILLPTPILAEVHTGISRIDVITARLLKAIGGDAAHIEPSSATWKRAGELRTDALHGGAKLISTTDAVVVAIAEERSRFAPVTIITSDQKDIEILVDLTLRPNIAVDAL